MQPRLAINLVLSKFPKILGGYQMGQCEVTVWYYRREDRLQPKYLTCANYITYCVEWTSTRYMLITHLSISIIYASYNFQELGNVGYRFVKSADLRSQTQTNQHWTDSLIVHLITYQFDMGFHRKIPRRNNIFKELLSSLVQVCQ